MKICGPDHRHGETTTCYRNHGCRCADCVIARARGDSSRYASCVRCPQMIRVWWRSTGFCDDCRFYFGVNREEYETWVA